VRTQIGTVEILRDRVYPRFPETDSDQTVYVEAGEWPVYRDDRGNIYWEMTGKPSRRRGSFQSLGDGMYMSTEWDELLDDEDIIFKSKAYTRDEFIDFAENHPQTQPGDAQRLIFKVRLS